MIKDHVKHAAYQRQWRLKNRELHLRIKRRCYVKNKHKRQSPEYKAKRNAYLKSRRNNPAVRAQELKSALAWRERNLDRHNAYNRNWRKSNVNYRLRLALSNRMKDALKRKAVRSARTLCLLGISSISELKTHLQSLFLNGMSWENRGQWHIDHIRPCASFDLRDPVQQKQCFHFSNLQPLWAKDNLKKGATYAR